MMNIRSLALAALALAASTTVRPAVGDTLVLHDGRRMTGEVTQTEAGYTVKMKAGQVSVPAGDVAKWEKDAPAGGTTPTPPPAPAATAPAALPSSAAAKPLTEREQAELRARVGQLIRQGGAALRDGDARAAIENFLDARALCDRARIRLDPVADPNHYLLMEGLGTAYMVLPRYEKANEPLDKAYAAPFRDRALVINRAILDMTQHVSVMRGIKDLTAHLESTSDHDEPALNLLGALLHQAASDPKLVKLPLFQQATATYEQKNKALEQTRPDEGRWGAEWISSFKLGIKKRAFKTHMRDYNDACDRRDKAADNVAAAEKAVEQARAAVTLGGTANRDANNYRLRSANDHLSDVKDVLARREADVKREWSKIEFPTWPKTFPVALPEFAGGGSWGQPRHKPVEVAVLTPAAAPKAAPKPTNNAVETPVPPPPRTPEAPPAVKAGKVSVTRYAVAVPVGPDLLLSAAAPLEGATEIRLESADGNAFTAEVVRRDAASGLALLRVAGQRWTYLNVAAAFGGGEVTCWGFPEVSIFNPVVDPINGTAGAPKAGAWNVALRRHPRLAGTAIVDKAGSLVGLTLGDRDSVMTQMPAATAEQIRSFLGSDAPQAPCSNPDPRGVFQVTATRDVK